jgi:hypothetical protein
MIGDPPQQWPVEQGDESARLLTWLSADGGSDATLEGAIVMVLRFVAGREKLTCVWELQTDVR